MAKHRLKDLDTYVYIDSSNIRNSLKVFDRKIDWIKLCKYFQETYKSLKRINYFEGIDKADYKKNVEFIKFRECGYTIKMLERKAYKNNPKYKIFKCLNCKKKNRVEILKKSKTFKSNIDVYLCSELMGDLLTYSKPVLAIILSCDGDYAEMIRNIINKNSNVHISVFATPFKKYNNYLSVRLKELERIDRYYLVNILNIKDKISN